MIIDAHLHVDDVPALGWQMKAELCVRRLDEAGVDAGIVMTITDWPEVNPNSLELVAGACATYPDRLYAFARMHPWYGDEAFEAFEAVFTDFRCFKGLEAPSCDDNRPPGIAEHTATDSEGRRAWCADPLSLRR